ncbi:MAG: deoxyribodipyrimidine photo-lyase, partial [Limnohabitans sp.]
MKVKQFTHFSSVLVWFRRDLRLDDHTALHLALQQGDKVFGCFVFDTDILDGLPAKDRRVSFIHASVSELDQKWRTSAEHPDAGLITRHGHAATEIVQLAKQLCVQAVFTHHDDEPA